MDELSELPSRRHFNHPFMTIHRSGRIYFSREAVDDLLLIADHGVSFFIDLQNQRFYLKTYAGKTRLRALPGRKMLVCNNQAFVERLFMFLESQKPTMPIGSLFKCLIAPRINDDGLHQILTDHTL